MADRDSFTTLIAPLSPRARSLSDFPVRKRTHFTQLFLRRINCVQRIIDVASERTEDKSPISRGTISFDHDFTNLDDVMRCVDCLSNRKNNTQINGGPFRPIKFTRGKGFEPSRKSPKAQPLIPITLERGFDHRTFSWSFSERKLSENPFDCNPCRNDVSPVCNRKNSVRLTSEKEIPLNPRGKNGHKDREHSPYCRPSFPVHHTSFAKPPTLTHSVENAHSLITLWTGGHSAMPVQPEEIGNG